MFVRILFFFFLLGKPGIILSNHLKLVKIGIIAKQDIACRHILTGKKMVYLTAHSGVDFYGKIEHIRDSLANWLHS